MKHSIPVVAAFLLAAASLDAQSVTPYRLGTFEHDGKTFVGIVLRDAYVIDFAEANATVQTPPSKVASPTDMKDLIARYDAGIRDRIHEIVAGVGDPSRSGRPSAVYDLKAVKTLPPIMYPTTMLNVAVNYRAHAVEALRLDPNLASTEPGNALPGTTSAPGLWMRAADDERWNPYMFLKAIASVIADGEAIRVPPNRDQLDWECELGVVIGRRGSHIPMSQARDYIFGYTLENDVSDRGGRGDARHGSDWVVMKSHDTFAPLGPFITPKEFVADPQKLDVRFTLNGRLMQDANTSLMIHTIDELLSYGSNIITLRPGDVISTGSPAGVGFARNPPVFMKAGDLAVCTYEGIGTLTNPVVGSGVAGSR